MWYSVPTGANHKFYNGGTNTLTVDTSGNVGIGTSSTNSKLTIYGTTQLQSRISLTGIEYYTGTNTNGDGIGLLLGVNRTSNRQLWIGYTANLTQNTTNTICRIAIGTSSCGIDAVATDGLTRLPFGIGGGAFNCYTNTYGSINKISKFHNIQVADDRAYMENLIFTEGAIVGGTFAGDTFYVWLLGGCH